MRPEPAATAMAAERITDEESDGLRGLLDSIGSDPAAEELVANALDYSAVATTIAAVVRNGKFRLIETAAERVAERVLADHPVRWLRLEVRKPIADGYTAVITIERAHEI